MRNRPWAFWAAAAVMIVTGFLLGPRIFAYGPVTDSGLGILLGVLASAVLFTVLRIVAKRPDDT